MASDAGCKNGTTIIVEELFANVPARRKFLKNDRSEGMAVAAVVEKIALSRPDISIKLIADNNQKMMTSGDRKLYNTVYSLFGKDFAKKIIKVDFMTGGIKVYGYIGTPENVRSNRNFENFFINGRYIKSKTASAALEQAYSSYMPSEKFPCAVLYIELHPATVDVNVHPTKLEVKFSNERAVFDAVYCAVKNALMDTGTSTTLFERSAIPQNAVKTYNAFTPVYDRMDGGETSAQISIVDNGEAKKAIDKTPFEDVATIYADTSAADTSVKDTSSLGFEKAEGALPLNDIGNSFEKKTEGYASRITPYVKEKESARSVSLPHNFYTERKGKADGICLPKADETAPSFFEKRKAEADPVYNLPLSVMGDDVPSKEKAEESREEIVPVKPVYKYLGVVFDTYILVEYDNKMLMIDKHAAHERIIFEKMRKNREVSSDKYQQICLVPIRVGLSREEFGACQTYKDDIAATGFDFELDNMTCSAVITAIPGGIEDYMSEELFVNMAGELAGGLASAGVTKTLYFERALYQASCKAAVKGGRRDSDEDMKYIVDCLLTDPKIRYCPHGRPVMFEVTQGTIEHKFKRT